MEVFFYFESSIQANSGKHGLWDSVLYPVTGHEFVAYLLFRITILKIFIHASAETQYSKEKASDYFDEAAHVAVQNTKN